MPLFTQLPMHPADAYMFYRGFFLFLFRPLQNIRQRFSGTAEQIFGRPYFVKVELMSQHVVWRRLSVCLSVTICIVEKRYILAINCLKEQIG